MQQRSRDVRRALFQVPQAKGWKMPILNPRRIVTKIGKVAILSQMDGLAIAGAFEGYSAYLVTAFEIQPITDDVLSMTLAGFGLGAPQEITPFTDPVSSVANKTYIASPVLTFTAVAITEAQVCIGVAIGDEAEVGNMTAFLEFDDPITLDENGETLTLAVEIGFAGQTFYLAPRVLPLGE